MGQQDEQLGLLELAGQMGLLKDPKIQLISQFMEQRRNAESQSSEAQVQQRRTILRRQKRVLGFLKNKNAELAAACGACVCWGENLRCGICHGQGRAAWQSPDEEMFIAYIKPVLDLLGLGQEEKLEDGKTGEVRT